MILDRLALCDFRAYSGRHEIPLTPRGKEGPCNIVLLGGLNGSGKTSLLLALRLALHGRLVLGRAVGETAYAAFLRECVHAPEGHALIPASAYVELEFTHGRMGRNVRHKVRRSWRVEGVRVRESLALWKDDSPAAKGSAVAAQALLNELAPAAVAEAFFVDGERIQALAEDESGAALRQTALPLLGLDLADRLRNDLRSYAARLTDKAESGERPMDGTKLERDYEAAVAEIEAAREALAKTESERERLLGERDALEAALGRAGGGDAPAERRALSASLTERIAGLEHELREALAGDAPLGLAQQAIEDACGVASSRLSSMTGRVVNEALRDFAAQLKAQGGSAAVVDGALAKALRPEEDKGGGEPGDLSHAAVARMEHAAQCAIPESRARVEALRQGLAEGRAAQRKVLLEIEAEPEGGALKEGLARLKSLNARAGSLQAKAAELRGAGCTAIDKAIAAARSLNQAHEAALKAKDSDCALALASATREAVATLRRLSAERKAKALEVEFTAALTSLARKDGWIGRATVDPQRFTVRLFGADGAEVRRSRLSAGEKHVYAIAMLHALRRVSGRRLPLVIDTPLGRLDTSHRTNLLAHHFPQASHQVILLATDAEIGPDVHQALAPNISHAFEIVHEAGGSSLRPGYFEGPVGGPS